MAKVEINVKAQNNTQPEVVLTPDNLEQFEKEFNATVSQLQQKYGVELTVNKKKIEYSQDVRIQMYNKNFQRNYKKWGMPKDILNKTLTFNWASGPVDYTYVGCEKTCRSDFPHWVLDHETNTLKPCDLSFLSRLTLKND